jgi:hypothetical protein
MEEREKNDHRIRRSRTNERRKGKDDSKEPGGKLKGKRRKEDPKVTSSEMLEEVSSSNNVPNLNVHREYEEESPVKINRQESNGSLVNSTATTPSQELSELKLKKRIDVESPMTRRRSRSLEKLSVPVPKENRVSPRFSMTAVPNLSKRHSRSFSDTGFFQQPNFQSQEKRLPERRIKINVGGRIFETYPSLFEKYPNTFLGAMFHPRNLHLLYGDKTEYFIDRDPRTFEIILNFYRTGKIIPSNWVPLELLREEMKFFSLDMPSDILHKRISMEMMKLDYKNKILDAEECRRISRQKLLSEHHGTIVKILDYFAKKIEQNAAQGHSSCDVGFFSPLHYTDYTERSVFNVISKAEIRQLIVELLREKNFTVTETEEFSKTKATAIIGLYDQVTNYNDPKFFSFTVKW